MSDYNKYFDHLDSVSQEHHRIAASADIQIALFKDILRRLEDLERSVGILDRQIDDINGISD